MQAWCHGRHRPDAEAGNKEGGYFPVAECGANRWLLLRGTIPSQCVLRAWPSPRGSDANPGCAWPLGVHDKHHCGNPDRPPRLRQRDRTARRTGCDYAGSFEASTAADGLREALVAAGECIQTLGERRTHCPSRRVQARPRLNAEQHRIRRQREREREKASSRRFKAKHFAGTCQRHQARHVFDPEPGKT